MCVVAWLEHTCFVKSGQLGLNVTKGNTVELKSYLENRKINSAKAALAHRVPSETYNLFNYT